VCIDGARICCHTARPRRAGGLWRGRRPVFVCPLVLRTTTPPAALARLDQPDADFHAGVNFARTEF